ncbi:hypothetical protein IV203_023474 [Nitzschia inconspicua]|uniref:Uncharacterized protein n=1 Tax=Nitzschia inconspicua TaxID=303405 RepID=A0A9K3KD55_9STRA|nr:hypothetical protein IV203_023474 [Nitzschia inconspicua]
MDCGGNDETDGCMKCSNSETDGCRKRSNNETDGCRKRSVTKIDGCGYESDSSLQHVPSPPTLHNNFMEMPLFPEDLKNRVLAETIAHSFSSPRAKQMKSFMDHMNYVPREKRQGFIKEALSVYINEKKSDKTDFDAVGEAKHSAAMPSRNRFLVAQKSGENEINDDGNFVSRNLFVVAQKSGENEIDDDGNPKKLQISNLSKTSKEWDDFPQSSVDLLHQSHTNSADALDSCGPGISLKRTWVSAARAIRDRTKEQMQEMWRLTKETWQRDGEGAMAETFAKTYIQDEDFSNWNYTASGLHGCVPCNNPMERHNLEIKGTADFSGLVPNRMDMLTCLTQGFVKLVFEGSKKHCCPEWGLPVLDYDRAANDDAFMKFQSLLDPKVDVKEYDDGWLLNDLHYLAVPITEDDIEKMKMALEGRLEDNDKTLLYDSSMDKNKHASIVNTNPSSVNNSKTFNNSRNIQIVVVLKH